MSKTKKYLMLLAAIGLIATAAGGVGTFAGFNAEVANQGNYFATGTLLLHNTANGGTTCTSESAANNINISNTGDTCTALFTVDLTSATATESATLALKNAGSLDASGISFYSPGCTNSSGLRSNTTLNGALSIAGGAINTITVDPVQIAVRSGQTVTVTSGGNSQTFTLTSAANVDDTTLNITSATPNFDYPDNSVVSSSPSFGSGDLCGNLQVAVEETSSNFLSDVGCAYGINVPATTCTFDSSINLSTIPSSATGLTLASGGGTGNTGTLLKASGTRYFVIRVKPDATNLDNTFQNRKAAFSVVWRIDQV